MVGEGRGMGSKGRLRWWGGGRGEGRGMGYEGRVRWWEVGIEGRLRDRGGVRLPLIT